MKKDWHKAIRKQRIAREIYGSDVYDNLHQYSKNKIHCSCDLCRRRPSWGAGKNSIKNESIPDQRKFEKLNYQEDEDNDLF